MMVRDGEGLSTANTMIVASTWFEYLDKGVHRRLLFNNHHRDF